MTPVDALGHRRGCSAARRRPADAPDTRPPRARRRSRWTIRPASSSNSASVACRKPRKLIVTTSNGSPIPEETPAMLNNASTCPPTDGDGAVDRCRVGQVNGVKFRDVAARRLLVQSDDVGTQLGELPDDVRADARRAPGHDRTATVVSPQLVDVSQLSNNFRHQDFWSFARCAAWTRPSLISAIASGISLAVNLPPRPVGNPPNE